jgi:hypothetical protein
MKRSTILFGLFAFAFAIECALLIRSAWATTPQTLCVTYSGQACNFSNGNNQPAADGGCRTGSQFVHNQAELEAAVAACEDDGGLEATCYRCNGTFEGSGKVCISSPDKTTPCQLDDFPHYCGTRVFTYCGADYDPIVNGGTQVKCRCDDINSQGAQPSDYPCWYEECGS